MKIQINITKDILEKSKMCGFQKDGKYISHHKNCAVANAVRDIMPNAIVDGTKILNIPTYNAIRIHLPEEAKAYIYLFDSTPQEQRVNLPEFSFEIELPEEFINSIGIEEAKEIISNSETLNLV